MIVLGGRACAAPLALAGCGGSDETLGHHANRRPRRNRHATEPATTADRRPPTETERDRHRRRRPRTSADVTSSITVVGGETEGGVQTIEAKQRPDTCASWSDSDAAGRDTPARLRHREGGRPRASPAVFAFTADLEGIFEMEFARQRAGDREARRQSVIDRPPRARALGSRRPPDPAWLFVWVAAAVLVISFVAPGRAVEDGRSSRDRPRRSAAASGCLASCSRTPLEVLCGSARCLPPRLTIWAGFVGVTSPGPRTSPRPSSTSSSGSGSSRERALRQRVLRVQPVAGSRPGVRWAATVRSATRPAGTPFRTRSGSALAGGRGPVRVRLARAALSGRRRRRVRSRPRRSSTPALTFLGMGLFGVDPWIQPGRGVLDVLRPLLPDARSSSVTRTAIVLRRPLAGLTDLRPMPGTVAVLAVMIGTVTFDGLQETVFWGDARPTRSRTSSDDLGTGSDPRGRARRRRRAARHDRRSSRGFYLLGCLGARTVGGGFGQSELARSVRPLARADRVRLRRSPTT